MRLLHALWRRHLLAAVEEGPQHRLDHRNITERTHGVDGATWHTRHSVFVGYSKPVPYLAAKAEAVQKAAIVGR